MPFPTRVTGSAAGAQRASAALAGTRFADVRWVAETGSTNADALALARDGAPEGIVVVADHQTAGRGRRDRHWVAPPRGIAAGVGAAAPARRAWRARCRWRRRWRWPRRSTRWPGWPPRLKWPNDLVVSTADGERKLAGILAEADWPAGSTISGGLPRPGAPRPGGRGGRHRAQRDLAGHGRRPGRRRRRHRASSGRGGGHRHRAQLARRRGRPGRPAGRVPRAARRPLRAPWSRRRPTPLLAAWRARSATLGRRVRVDLGADDVEGTAVDVTADGHLVVETAEGDRRTLAVGDVVHLRPA